VSTPAGEAARSKSANAYGLAPLVGMPGNEVAVWPAAIGVPKPIENTLVNVPA
jgi:hypothetical protein